MNAQGTKFIIESDEYDIETALREYRIDLVSIFDEQDYCAVQLSTEYTLEGNEKVFLWVDAVAIGLLKSGKVIDNTHGEDALYRRSMHRSPKTALRVGKLIKIIYDAILSIENLARE